MNFHLVVHLPLLVGWGPRTSAIYDIIPLYYHALYYHIMLSYYSTMYHNKEKLSNSSAGIALLSYVHESSIVKLALCLKKINLR